MHSRTFNSLIIGLLLSLVYSTTSLFAQDFVRVESISGFNGIAGNNGVAVADYDRDLDLDIFIVAMAKDENGIETTHSKLFRNNNDGSFTDVTIASGLVDLLPLSQPGDEFSALKGFKYGVSWGDFDNDGFPDIFFTHTYQIQLFRNQGDGSFEDVTEDAGLDIVNNCRNTGASWWDYDNDGYLDLYVNDWNECNSNTLYRNNGDGTFTDVTVETGLNTQGIRASFTALPFDFNGDDWMDLLITNDLGDPNELFISQNGTSFIEQAQQYGVNSMVDDRSITVSDYNHDGFYDLFITAIDKNILYTNNGDNTFTDMAPENHVDNTGWSSGATFADFDLDGDEDLFIVNGFDIQGRNSENNVYFKNLFIEGQNDFTNISNEVNLGDLTISVEVIDFDYDNDGDLDLFVTNSDGSSYFYENKLLNFDQPSTLHYFKVSLQGTTSNKDAIGTKLSLTTNDGTILRYYTGIGFLSQSLQAVHFGLGDQSEILNLNIIWPSGLVENYENLNSNTHIRATEGSGFVVLDIEPSIKIYGCVDPNSCSYNPEATLDDGSCTYLESFEISGATNSGFYKTEVYSYPQPVGSSLNWRADGGKIVSGQNTDSVTVQWGLQETASISVVETNSECSSLEISLEIALHLQNLPEDISIARLWNEVLLEAIRGDYARPTVHARNLFHISVAMYDAWAIYDEEARPYLVGNKVHNFESILDDFNPEENQSDSRNKAISYAAYRLLEYRFHNSPQFEHTKELMDLLMNQLEYDSSDISESYENGNASALGNYIAKTIIEYGSNDGSREATGFDNDHYEPVNKAMAPAVPGNPTLTDPNRWQPLSLDTYIDQSGNIIDGSTPEFLSPEWGDVHPFAMTTEQSVTYSRFGNQYTVYHDPLAPPKLNLSTENPSSEAYKWGFSLVNIWASHLDPSDDVIWDISPNAIGNIDINDFPDSIEDYPNFYNLYEGGDIGTGRSLNPITNLPYEKQLVPRGDYTRVLAEFWADGPDSETPPGHWFTLLNYINDSPLLIKKLGGEGEILNALEWDVKAYFILGGTMHDVAISSWSIKGWYDYIRPISSIRYMADLGQSTDSSLENYHVAGIPLSPGYIEIVELGDPLAGISNQHIGKIKLFTWKGPDFIIDPDVDQAGVDWILAEYWWPYQRPTFVTPPFAGYVSGHSTYSRAGAEVFTLLTGSPYFPGGYGEFIAKKNEFLVFEEGPSVDIKLQWATYRDASDQCSLSRIWGGIHPPADDIPGRKIGEIIGVEAYHFAIPYFSGKNSAALIQETFIYPNPTNTREVFITNTEENDTFELFDITGRYIKLERPYFNPETRISQLKLPPSTATGIYILKINDGNSKLLIVNSS